MNSVNHEKAAIHLLENPSDYPGLVTRDVMSVEIRIWVFHSFEPYRSWSVHRERKTEKRFLRRVVWDQRQRVLTTEPRTFGAESPIETSVVLALKEELSSLRLPPFIPVNTTGLDGITYGVELGSFALSARLSWWCSPPDEWALLARWHAEAVKQFESLLPQTTPSIRDNAH
jgi:hypothetical protein